MTAYSPADRICALLKAVREESLTHQQLEQRAGLTYASAAGYVQSLIAHGLIATDPQGRYMLAQSWKGPL